MRILEVLLMTLGGIWQGVRQDFNLLEIGLVAAAAWAWKRGWRPRLQSVPLRCPTWMLALFLAAGTVALRVALIPLLPVPIPVVTDEFSHLLLADTLLHRRVANPTHPFWQHFESLHIIQQPHYVSSYFPGHAAVLAAARAITGNPWAGVLAESGVFLAILYWMLRGWMPGRWALFGTLLAALRFGIGSYWVNSYYGGFLAAIGGAMVAGAFPRLRREARVVHGIALGTGLAVLAATRPFEGALFSLPLVAMLVWEFRRKFIPMLRFGLPAVVIVGLTICMLGFYFSRITGSPFVTVYQISMKAYGWPLSLTFSTPPQIEHRHVELARYYEFEKSEHEQVDGPVHFVEYLTFRLQESWRFFLGPVLTLPLIMLGRVWRRRPALILGVSGNLAAVLVQHVASPHYLAPATAMMIGILVECCRHLRASRLGMVPLVPATMALVLALRIGAGAVGLPYTQKLNYPSWCCRVQGDMNKERITEALNRIPGNHLVIVKAKTDENNLLQWIYNEADIDGSRIVWARDMGGARNAELRSYFFSRDVWVVDPNINPATCRKYEEEKASRTDANNAEIRSEQNQVNSLAIR